MKSKRLSGNTVGIAAAIVALGSVGILGIAAQAQPRAVAAKQQRGDDDSVTRAEEAVDSYDSVVRCLQEKQGEMKQSARMIDGLEKERDGTAPGSPQRQRVDRTLRSVRERIARLQREAEECRSGQTQKRNEHIAAGGKVLVDDKSLKPLAREGGRQGQRSEPQGPGEKYHCQGQRGRARA